MVEMQRRYADDFQINMFVPDLHSFTTPIDHSNLYSQTLENLKVFVAAGLDINAKNTFIYRQSYVPAHSELQWILSCFTYFGELSRMTQFKDKSKQLIDASISEDFPSKNPEDAQFLDFRNALLQGSYENRTVTAGLFNYPILMAADILLYDAEWVPVGEDQKQHLELTRDIAIRLNNKFNKHLFTVPHKWADQLEFAHRSRGVRVRSLRNPDKKMSKSIDDPRGTILLTDLPSLAAKKIRSATTDERAKVAFDFKFQPGVTNLLQILALLSGTPQERVNAKWTGLTEYSELKQTVAEEVEKFLEDFQARLNTVDEKKLIEKLEHDEKIMREVTDKKLHLVQKAVGLRPKS